MNNRLVNLCGLTALLLMPLAMVRAADPAAQSPVKYEPTEASLKQAEVPEWFMDICKLFKAPKFDQAQADRLVKLYKQAGARYVVPVAAHHDNFDMWDSKYQPRWNSMATAGKDVCGMWQKATVANGLHFGVASHVARSSRWLQTSHGADKTGLLAEVPYDGNDPAFVDLYGVPWKSSDPGYEGPQDVGPPEFEKNFVDRMLDLIDRYHPDLYYTDGGPPFKTAGYTIVSHLYNQSLELHGGKLEAVANFKGGCPIGAENCEFEFPGTLQKNFWQTDKTMGAEWYWLRNRRKDYKKGFEIVHTLIDVVSKNGNLLLNVPLTGDGELEEEVVTMLKDMAKVAKGFGPIFANGIDNGMYKLDLATAKSITRVNTFSSSGKHRAKQNYILYGSNAAKDPGWNVADAAVFTPIVAVDTRLVEPKEYEATSIRRSDGNPLGSYRWLVWAVFPVTGEIGGENTAFQELQAIPAADPSARP